MSELGTVETKVPARLDRLPWARFHWMVIVGLGTVWILDGLEVTIVGSIAARLTEKDSGLALSDSQVLTAGSIYVAGACVGALFFGQLTDRLGRKKLFLATLVLYLVATIATAFAGSALYFYIARFFTGAGIGGEYAAINSAIDELIPARVRGRVDLVINGSYWLGAAGGALGSLLLLDTNIFAPDIGWRLAFGIGAVLGLGILIVRRHVPESPRWLFIHGREEEAERIVGGIEDEVEQETGETLDEPGDSITVRQRKVVSFREIASTAFSRYPRRTTLGFALFVGALMRGFRPPWRPPYAEMDTTKGRAVRTIAARPKFRRAGALTLIVAVMCFVLGFVVLALPLLVIAAVAAIGMAQADRLAEHPERWRIDDDVSPQRSPLTPMRNTQWRDSRTMSIGAVLSIVGVAAATLVVIAALVLH